MAYKLLYGGYVLFDPYTDDVVVDAKLTAKKNNPDYLDFTITKKHSLYDMVAERDKIVELYFGDVKLFSGIITSITIDMNGNKAIACDGALTYLQNTLIRPYSTIEGEQPLTAPSSVDGLFKWYIDQHNDATKNSLELFTVGTNQGAWLDKNNYVYRSSEQLPTVWSEISNKILDELGGFVFVNYEDDKIVIDLYSDVHKTNSQIIDFGVNIVDFEKTIDTGDQYTAVRPSGKTPEAPENNRNKKMHPITIESLPNLQSDFNTDFVKMGDVVYSLSAVARYGYKEYSYSNSDIETQEKLLNSAYLMLAKLISPVTSITVKAVDLAMYMTGYTHLKVGEAVRIRSALHKTDEYLAVNAITLDLNNPENTEYELGDSYDSLTGQQSTYLKNLNASINKSLDSVASLDKASKDAAIEIKDVKTKTDKISEDVKVVESTANKASEDASKANQAAANASQQANSAFTASKDAADKAIAASKAADEASAKATLAETNSSEAKEASQNATKAANDANTAATTATATANKASEDAANAIKSAQSANDAATDAASKADAATTEVGKVKSQIDDVNGEITDIKSNATQLRDDLTGQITSVKETMEADYAKTTDLTATSETLRNEISNSAAGTLQTVSSTYAKKAELETTTTLAQEAKDAASTNAKDLTNAINKVNTDMSSLQDQIDGAIETWFFDGVPSNDNEPASDWTTDTLKKNHLGDLYYDNLTGYSYRWQIQNGVYSWARITDVDVTKALKDAKNAQETANSKRRVFSSTPYPPYDEGDLWVQGKSGDILRCTVAKSADQTYADADWSLASKYTDDSAVTTLKNTVETTYATKTTVETLSDKWSSTASSVETVKIDLKAAQESAKQANEAATAAQESANTAIENAATAQAKADEAAQTASDATKNAATANTAAANAQKAADDAAKKAATAQSNADTANAELATAKTKLEEIQNQANATDEQVAAAKAAVEKAQTAADKANEAASTANAAASDAKKAADIAKENAATAQSTADTAKANADTAQSTADTAKANAATAQSTADTAKNTADKATQDLASVTNRVTIAETNISNNAEAINLRATKTEVTQAVNDASVSSKSYTDAQLKIASESITATVSKTYATKADLDTTNENVTNAQNTANSASTRIDSVDTIIRATTDGIEVAKKINGNYTSTRALVTDSEYQILSKDGSPIAKYGSEKVSIGIGSNDTTIEMNNGRVKILTRNMGSTNTDGISDPLAETNTYIFNTRINNENVSTIGLYADNPIVENDGVFNYNNPIAVPGLFISKTRETPKDPNADITKTPYLNSSIRMNFEKLAIGYNDASLESKTFSAKKVISNLGGPEVLYANYAGVWNDANVDISRSVKDFEMIMIRLTSADGFQQTNVYTHLGTSDYIIASVASMNNGGGGSSTQTYLFTKTFHVENEGKRLKRLCTRVWGSDGQNAINDKICWVSNVYGYGLRGE